MRRWLVVASLALWGCPLTTDPLRGQVTTDGDADADADGDGDGDGDADADADADGDADGDAGCVVSGTAHACGGGGAAACCSLQCSGDECVSEPECFVVDDGCATNEDCCSRSCGPAGRCLDIEGDCRPRGELCLADRDCCGRYCHGNPPHCSSPPDEPCLALGEICTPGGDGGCCSGSCVEGRCGPSAARCPGTGEPCVDAGDCCSDLLCQDQGEVGPSRCGGGIDPGPQ